MRVVTGKQMNKLDAWAQEVMGIPVWLLMENAGRNEVGTGGRLHRNTRLEAKRRLLK